MTDVTWLGVVAIATGYQLAVLPGEKGQFIIAGLSTQYNPLLVVSAAGSAFAGWTVLEIWFGQALVETLPGIYLDALTAGLFLVFAILLVRSAPPEAGVTEDGATIYHDGGELDVTIPGLDIEIPERFGGFLPIFAMMAFGEFGDKTQLITIALASQYAAYPTAIWTGEMLAIIPVSLVNAFFFYRFSNSFDVRKAHFAGAAIFGFFALDFLVGVLFGVSPWAVIVDSLATLV
ncbi:MAG: TMEM165/GDT1 family protein [Halobacteriaceae archaeon]